jgi:6-phosphogluconolactonase
VAALPAHTVVLADADAIAREAADRLVAALSGPGAQFAVCLSGGSTPKRLYALLASAPYRQRIPWDRTHWFLGDERVVAADDPASNQRMMREAFGDASPIPPALFHPIPTNGTPQAGAEAYDAELRAFRGADAGRPLFDLTLLGLGEDGHTASLFPGKPALDVTDRLAAPVPEAGQPPYVPRITLTFPALAASRATLFLVSGAAKGVPLARVAAGEDLPAARAARAANVTWLLDRAAAGA